ncbi:789_t:CDS:2, partial [Paraglomus brasilianum]
MTHFGVDQVMRCYGSYLGRQSDEESHELLQQHGERVAAGTESASCLNKKLPLFPVSCREQGTEVDVGLCGAGISFRVSKGLFTGNKYKVESDGDVSVHVNDVKFLCAKIPVTFNDFEDFSKGIVDLMNWQTDVLLTVKKINKAWETKNDGIHITLIQDTPPKMDKTR